MIYSQIVTWTAFAILAMFCLESLQIVSNIVVALGLRDQNQDPGRSFALPVPGQMFFRELFRNETRFKAKPADGTVAEASAGRARPGWVQQSLNMCSRPVHKNLFLEGLASHCKAKTTFAFHFSIINA